MCTAKNHCYSVNTSHVHRKYTIYTASEDSRPYVTVQADFRILQRIPTIQRYFYTFTKYKKRFFSISSFVFLSGLLALVIQTGCSENATMSQPRIDQLFKFIEKTRISDDNKNTLVSAKADVQQINVSSRIINNRP